MFRKSLLILTAILIVGAWAGLAMSVDPRTLQRDVPQVAPPPEMMRTTGTVEGYVKGKKIQVTTSGGTLRTFSIVSGTAVEGKVKKGARVAVIYQEQKDKLVANKIVVVLR